MEHFLTANTKQRQKEQNKIINQIGIEKAKKTEKEPTCLYKENDTIYNIEKWKCFGTIARRDLVAYQEFIGEGN